MSKHDEELVLAPKKPPADEDFDITPMIDCVFLLLFFFMLTSKMDISSTIVQPLAVNGENLAPDKLVIISASIADNGDASFYTGDTTRPDRQVVGDLPQIEQNVKQYIEQQVAQRPETIGILVKADGKIKQKYIAMFARAATAAGGGRQLYAGVQQE